MLRYFVKFMFLSTWLIHKSFLMQINKVMYFVSIINVTMNFYFQLIQKTDSSLSM